MAHKKSAIIRKSHNILEKKTLNSTISLERMYIVEHCVHSDEKESDIVLTPMVDVIIRTCLYDFDALLLLLFLLKSLLFCFCFI